MKWQGLSISRWPTDGRPRPNPGEESVRCNKVKTPRSALTKAIHTLKEFGKNKDTGHSVSQSDLIAKVLTNEEKQVLAYRTENQHFH